ncbi:arginase family protein [Natronomonas sp. LN261]|jgi:agmatinase|uniref:arginase family protein n=1 Tax=Natronomonas sp. LN261 TaxID=2750669 RepID=UPI0015EF4016|nr:arginase family protein [Natronomonas sp. LN261]
MAGFPGADADLCDAAYAVVGAPLDVSTTFRPGARFGPDRIRRFARPFDGYDRRTDRHFGELVADDGDLPAWDEVAEYLRFLEGELGDHRADGRIPLLLGGEHTVSVAGVRATEPEVYVCLDAHLDLYDAYAGNERSHATVTRRALETAENAVLLGVRTGSEAEWDRAMAADVTVVAPEDVRSWEPAFDGSAYLSVDIDAADPGFAPGTGTPAPFGLRPREMRDLVRTVAPHAVGFDVVEVNDRDDGQAAALAGKLLQEFVFSHADG